MKKNKYIVNISMVVILLFASIAMYLLYPSIKQTVAKQENPASYIQDYASSHLDKYNYLIDLELKKKANEDTSLDQYIQTERESGYYDRSYNFINDVEGYKDLFSKQSDFQYYAINTKSNEVFTNTEDDLSTIHRNDELKDKYQWYIQFQFDNTGKLNVAYASDNSHYWSSQNTVNNSRYSYEDEEGTVNISNPKNLTITYAVSNTLEPDSQLTDWIANNSVGRYLQYALVYIFLIAACIFILTIVTPYKYLEKATLLNVFAKIKFEFLSVFWIIVTSFMSKLSPRIISLTSTSQFSTFMDELGIKHLDNFFNISLNLIFWFIFFFLVMLLAFMIRYLFHKGLKAYCKENTAIGWVFYHSGKLLDKIVNFDFNNKTNRVVLKIVIFNFIIITIISFFFVFGLFFSLLYSIIIFCILKKKFDNIQKDYQVLLNAAKQLSDGNFDIQIQEDVGIFNPLKDEFSHIKSGFEKAVKEEVKSQKTKTELISNVSHDLKTPLTSIITYIDLLKSDSLSNEDKDKYLQILDRNSLRLKHLIEDLFEVSKANSGDIKLNYENIDIIALIKQVQYECSDKLDEKNLDLRTNFADEKIICNLDGEKTYRIFENLFMNISKYSLAHTRVYINIEEFNDSVQITFKNISEIEMRFNEKDIVERFVQGDESRNTSGSGLGLAIVKSFTELQQGQFKIELDGDLFKSVLIFKK